jgi:hypothetical protein
VLPDFTAVKLSGEGSFRSRSSIRKGWQGSRRAGGWINDALGLAVEYFIGMPSWQAAGDSHYRVWMTHTPHGTVIDDPLSLGSIFALQGLPSWMSGARGW